MAQSALTEPVAQSNGREPRLIITHILRRLNAAGKKGQRRNDLKHGNRWQLDEIDAALAELLEAGYVVAAKEPNKSETRWRTWYWAQQPPEPTHRPLASVHVTNTQGRPLRPIADPCDSCGRIPGDDYQPRCGEPCRLAEAARRRCVRCRDRWQLCSYGLCRKCYKHLGANHREQFREMERRHCIVKAPAWVDSESDHLFDFAAASSAAILKPLSLEEVKRLPEYVQAFAAASPPSLPTKGAPGSILKIADLIDRVERREELHLVSQEAHLPRPEREDLQEEDVKDPEETLEEIKARFFLLSPALRRAGLSGTPTPVAVAAAPPPPPPKPLSDGDAGVDGVAIEKAAAGFVSAIARSHGLWLGRPGTPKVRPIRGIERHDGGPGGHTVYRPRLRVGDDPTRYNGGCWIEEEHAVRVVLIWRQLLADGMAPAAAATLARERVLRYAKASGSPVIRTRKSRPSTVAQAAEIGRRIAAIRRRRGLTQLSLSMKVGQMRSGAISAIECGRWLAKPTTLERIAKALKVDFAELIGTAKASSTATAAA